VGHRGEWARLAEQIGAPHRGEGGAAGGDVCASAARLAGAQAARRRRRRGAALARMLARSRPARLALSCKDSIDGDRIRTGANMSFHVRNVWQTNRSVNGVLFSVQIPTFRWYFTCPRSFGGIFRISGSFSAIEPIFPFFRCRAFF